MVDSESESDSESRCDVMVGPTRPFIGRKNILSFCYSIFLLFRVSFLYRRRRVMRWHNEEYGGWSIPGLLVRWAGAIKWRRKRVVEG